MIEALKALKEAHEPILVMGNFDNVLGSGFVQDVIGKGRQALVILISEIGQKSFIKISAISSFHVTLLPELVEPHFTGVLDGEDEGDFFYS